MSREARKRRRRQQATDEALKSRKAPTRERILALLPSLDAGERQRVRQALDELAPQDGGGEQRGGHSAGEAAARKSRPLSSRKGE